MYLQKQPLLCLQHHTTVTGPIIIMATFLKKKIYYFFIYDRQRGRDTGGGRSRLHAGSLMQDSIRQPQDCTLGQSQTLNC